MVPHICEMKNMVLATGNRIVSDQMLGAGAPSWGLIAVLHSRVISSVCEQMWGERCGDCGCVVTSTRYAGWWWWQPGDVV